MLDKIYKDSRTIKELREGPIGNYIEDLARHYISHGYKAKNIKARFGVISGFNRWLVKNNLALTDLNEETLNTFIASRLKRTNTFITSGGHAALERLLAELRQDGLIPNCEVNRTQPQSTNTWLQSYSEYLVQEKGLSLSTVTRYTNDASNFLLHYALNNAADLNHLSAQMILDYVQSLPNRYSTKHSQVVVSALRSFFRFLFIHSVIEQDLAVALPSIPSWRAAHLPEFLTTSQTSKLLETCDRRTHKGRRNYSILLLLVRLGLRASEIITLTLDDIDWRAGELEIRGKSNKIARLPLPVDVGDAIIAYLQNGRPRCNTRSLFVRTKAPYRGFHHPSSVSTIVRRALDAAGITTQLLGAHLLRYTMAQNCLCHGATLHELRELMRHTSIDTTALYTKIDFKQLRKLAPLWPTSAPGGTK